MEIYFVEDIQNIAGSSTSLMLSGDWCWGLYVKG